MPFTDAFSYFITLLAINLAPGPVTMLLMARSASNDVMGAMSFAVGAAFGSLSIVTAVCFGMSAWISEVPEVLTYSKYVMLAYILWIARDIVKGNFDMNGKVKHARSGSVLAIAAGFMTCVLSPYMLLLFPLVLPEIMDITVLRVSEFLVITFTTFAAQATAAILIIYLAAQLKRLARSERSMFVLNRSLASLLVFGGGWLALT